ncbi:TioE family transcriptional regulator [Micromonospora echinospora]
MDYLRPVDLARQHGISTQAVRNYEKDGCLPPAIRTASGYRQYTQLHAKALRAYLALVRAHGHEAAGEIMRALNDGDLYGALRTIDRGHDQLQRDRRTLDTVAVTLESLAVSTFTVVDTEAGATACTIGELARRLGVTAVTLRNWQRAGILTPRRDPARGHRLYDAEDIRDAALTELLRRGGYSLEHIRVVVEQLRVAGGVQALNAALRDWRQGLVNRGLAMLNASAAVSEYLSLSQILQHRGPAPRGMRSFDPERREGVCR